MNSFLLPINMLPHDSNAKYQWKRNPQGPEQAGSKEKEEVDKTKAATMDASSSLLLSLA
jgi:hypothetical protein